MFFINSFLLGVGLAMDAFSVSVANGLSDPKMKLRKSLLISCVFAVFQALMPLGGWYLVHNLVTHFRKFEKMIPWIALFLLIFIGVKMIVESRREDDDDAADQDAEKLGFGALIVQGIATSIDALSVGFTIADYGIFDACICASIIGAVTFVLSYIGVRTGSKIGDKFKGKAEIFGGIILIIIGIEIFVKGVFIA